MAAPDDSAYSDNPYGATDPYAMYGKLSDENALDRSSAGGIRQGALNAGFNPQMQHAQAVQANLQRIMQDTQQKEGEDPLDWQLRQATAISHGMLSVDPATAVRANQQVIRLQEAQRQQAKLSAETQDKAQEAQSRKIANLQARTVLVQSTDDVINGITLRGSKTVGDSLNPSDSDYATQLQKGLLANPGAVPMSVDEYNKRLAAEGQNRAFAMAYGQQQRVAAQAAYSGKQLYEQMTDTQKDTAAYSWATDPKSQVADLNEKGERRFNEYVDRGDLQQGDQTAARAELGALNRATLTAAQREGTIKGLQDSLVGMGDNVKRNLDKAVAVGVSPTDIRILNGAINASDANFMINDHTEKGVALRNLFVSINAFLYEHGRLLSGGGARTNVAAVNDAKKNMTAKDSPDVIRGAIDTITKQELPVLHSANKNAIIALSDPKSYPAISRMMKVFGGQNMMGGQYDQSGTASIGNPNQNPTAAPAAAPKPAPAPVGAGHGTSTTDFSHLWSTPSG